MLTKLVIQPGLMKNVTDYAAGPYWTDGSRVRFRDGFPETIGGWVSDPDHTATGVPRVLRAFRTLEADDIIAIGTHKRLQIIYNGTLYDITPLRATVDPMGADPFATSTGSSTVTVTDAGHGVSNGNEVLFSGATSVNGLTIDGYYTVTNSATNTYDIDAGSSATGTGSGGGSSVKAEYLISPGAQHQTAGLGWGAASWGDETWGEARTSSALTLELRRWSLDIWGEDLVACDRNGGVYHWDETTGPNVRAALVSNSPTTARFILVTSPDRHLVAFGAHDGSADNWMNVAWCDQENLTTWTPAAGNTAGSQLLTEGTKLVTAVRTRNTVLVFTNDSVYSMVNTGVPFTFGFFPQGTDCGIIGQDAAIDVNGVVYWMGDGSFYRYDGSVKDLPCTVRDEVFDNINQEQKDKVSVGVNKLFHEIWWFYPTATLGENTNYVTFNYVDGTWSAGTLNRSCFLDKAYFLNNPIAMDENGTLFYHEEGITDDGSALNPFIETGGIELSAQGATDGDMQHRVDKIIPDITLTGEAQVLVKTRQYPNGTQTTKGPYTITTNTKKLSIRARGREMQYRIYSDTAADSWKLGAFRINLNPDSGR